jgi:abortive infection bacteriophage resistance protein
MSSGMPPQQVPYTKPALTVTDQASLLLNRGMVGDRALMESRLEVINYYRLSGYSYPFKKPDDTFLKGTTFDAVWARYVFDRQMRLLVMDAIERIEITVRSKLAYEHAHGYGPFDYTSAKSFPNLTPADFGEFTAKISEEFGRSKEEFVKHFNTKYSGDPPIWVATEVMSFGQMLTMFKGSNLVVQQTISNCFRIPLRVFISWLLTLNTVRNFCAHHSRLWNRQWGIKPLMPNPKIYPDWSRPVPVANDRLFGVLTICRYCLSRIAPQSKWHKRVECLLTASPSIPLNEMGFPADWQKCPIWK